MMEKVLALTTCRLSMSTTLFWCWIRAFNLLCPIGLYTLLWFTFKEILLEFYHMFYPLARTVAHILEVDWESHARAVPRFSVAMKPKHKLVASVEAISGNDIPLMVEITYETRNLGCSKFYSFLYLGEDRLVESSPCPPMVRDQQSVASSSPVRWYTGQSQYQNTNFERSNAPAPPSSPSSTHKIDKEGFTLVQRRRPQAPRRPLREIKLVEVGGTEVVIKEVVVIYKTT